MRLSDLARSIGARVLTNESRAAAIQIDQAYAANRMSELLEKATAATLLISDLSNPHLLRVADLLDVPGICLAQGALPSDKFVQTASEHGKVLLLSPDDLSETCRRLRAVGITCAS